MDMKVIVAGGRDFNDGVLLGQAMLPYRDDPATTVICGMARGADALGAVWARHHGLPVIEMPAQWDLYGKSAGYRRNVEMAKVADVLMAFWDGKSRGTAHMIQIAKDHGLPTTITYYGAGHAPL
jgi:hypothetical protein